MTMDKKKKKTNRNDDRYRFGEKMCFVILQLSLGIGRFDKRIYFTTAKVKTGCCVLVTE